MSPEITIEKLYRKFYRAGRPLAGAQTHAETFREFVQKLIYKLDELDERSGFKKLLTGIKNNTMALTDLYESVLFIDTHVQKATRAPPGAHGRSCAGVYSLQE